MFIENVAMADIPTAFHMDAGERAMLIQILDPCMRFPIPKAKFEIIKQFEFLDVEPGGRANLATPHDYDDLNEFAMTRTQAKEIVALLKQALEERRNVVVHCFAGICRSGAVAEVGVMMGFQDTPRYRQPNVHVKQLLMNELGWSYAEQLEKQPDSTFRPQPTEIF
jgi:predicted protein tyrosine phosphatase